MDKYLKPARFDCDPNSVGADKQFKHWLRTFQDFIGTIKSTVTTPAPATTDSESTGTVQVQAGPTEDELKLRTLTNYVSANVFEYIVDCTTYDDAIETLSKI